MNETHLVLDGVEALWDRVRSYQEQAKDVCLGLYHPELEGITNVKIAAYSISVSNFCALQESAKIAEQDSKEGHIYTFTVASEEELPSVQVAYCGSKYGVWESVRGNKMIANGDVDATKSGVKSENLYVFWIEEWQKYGFMRERYWCY